MLFGLLSLLMGHWIEFAAKICIKSSSLSSRFYPCARKDEYKSSIKHITLYYLNGSVSQHQQVTTGHHGFCPEVRGCASDVLPHYLAIFYVIIILDKKRMGLWFLLDHGNTSLEVAQQDLSKI